MSACNVIVIQSYFDVFDLMYILLLSLIFCDSHHGIL